MMKKSIGLVLIIAILLVNLTPVYASSNAKTLGELKQELSSLKSKKKNTENSKKQTQSDITSAKNNIANKQDQIITNQGTIESAKTESERLTKEIEDGKEELKELVSNYEILDSNDAYLEYLFDSESYSDFIFNYSVVEELMNYENDKINEWNEKIEYNTQLQKDLALKEIQLNDQIDSLHSDIKSLGNKISELDDMVLDIDADIKSIQNSINYYKSIGCKDNQLLSECIRIARDTKFRLPLNSGRISSQFGYRRDPITGKAKKFHSGTDIAASEGNKIYAIANGTVVKKWERSSCGGNALFIQHMVNGKKYTSAYLHMLKFNVKIGDKVTSETIIGYVGGGSTSKRRGGYDGCTTGAHLHLSLANGWYGTDYVSYDSFRSHLINPKSSVPLPSSWSRRI